MEHTSVSSSSSAAPALNHSNGYPSAESAAAAADMVHGYFDTIDAMSDKVRCAVFCSVFFCVLPTTEIFAIPNSWNFQGISVFPPSIALAAAAPA